MHFSLKHWRDPVLCAPTNTLEEELAKMPSLAKPFAAFGAVAGLFAILAIGSFREAARDVSPFTPMIAHRRRVRPQRREHLLRAPIGVFL